MLITFQSKAAADVVMYQDHAKNVLDLLHKNGSRGVITAAESSAAIATLEAEIAAIKSRPKVDEVHPGAAAHHGDYDDDHERSEAVSFAVRVYPLLEMLRAAHKEGRDVMWGV